MTHLAIRLHLLFLIDGLGLKVVVEVFNPSKPDTVSVPTLPHLTMSNYSQKHACNPAGRENEPQVPQHLDPLERTPTALVNVDGLLNRRLVPLQWQRRRRRWREGVCILVLVLVPR